MDAVVQFVRNLLCCVKDWELFRDTVPFLYDSSIIQTYYELPEPFNKTTPLEVLISTSQFYAFSSVSKSGYKMIVSNFHKLQRIQRLFDIRNKDSKTSTSTPSDLIINKSLLAEADDAIKGMFVGINVLFIGLAFFWLFCNSWHVTETDLIGGVPGLIHALTVMEIALIPLLFYMYKDGTKHYTDASRLEDMIQSMNDKNGFPEMDLNNLETVQMLSDWKPFWTDEDSSIDRSKEERQIQMEVEKVTAVLNDLSKAIRIKSDKSIDTKKDTDDDDKAEKESKIRREEIIRDIQVKVEVHKWNGMCEYLYLIINFVAFYGYLMAVVTFYYDNDEEQPDFIRKLKFGAPNHTADWHGNFAGDLMWTIEPILILSSPFVVKSIENKKTPMVSKSPSQQQQSSSSLSSNKAKTE